MADADLNNDARQEVSMSGDSKNAENGQLLTPEYFQKWRTQHAGPLRESVEKRRRTAQEAEDERFAKARSAVIGGVQRWMREGYTATEAGKRLASGHSDWDGYLEHLMTDLLPHNATPQERAISEATERLGAVPTPIRDVWNADTCPAKLLPWLAWAFSVDQWDSGWSEAQQRAFIKRSVEIHRYKGTIGAVKDALAALFIDVRVQEWFNQEPPGDPYTFRVLLEADQVGADQAAMGALIGVIERTKNLRSHLTGVELTVRSATGPRVAVVAGVGSEITLCNFQLRPMILNETTIVI